MIDRHWKASCAQWPSRRLIDILSRLYSGWLIRSFEHDHEITSEIREKEARLFLILVGFIFRFYYWVIVHSLHDDETSRSDRQGTCSSQVKRHRWNRKKGGDLGKRFVWCSHIVSLSLSLSTHFQIAEKKEKERTLEKTTKIQAKKKKGKFIDLTEASWGRPSFLWVSFSFCFFSSSTFSIGNVLYKFSFFHRPLAIETESKHTKRSEINAKEPRCRPRLFDCQTPIKSWGGKKSFKSKRKIYIFQSNFILTFTCNKK